MIFLVRKRKANKIKHKLFSFIFFFKSHELVIFFGGMPENKHHHSAKKTLFYIIFNVFRKISKINHKLYYNYSYKGSSSPLFRASGRILTIIIRIKLT